MRFGEQHLDAILKEKLLLKVELLWGLKSGMWILKPCEKKNTVALPCWGFFWEIASNYVLFSFKMPTTLSDKN